ncbi:lipopolysaccharide kinase InaA family protein [Trichloromonas sp.]|uniref:lipopolysaccharide kinase InaA family protein n=1 Tax=Trichloromonas sp. TaxID=3069249 RepID=UPI002A4BC09F|nr:lipopolysaccharide kinase InaA family protein [Trichloromonas sp.]
MIGDPLAASYRQRRGPFVAYFATIPEYSGLLELLLPDPDHLFASGESVVSPWQSVATDKVVIEFAGRSLFLKRYNCLGVGYRIKNIFRASRALKSWRAGWQFLELGVPTPKPLACLEERRFRLLGRSYVLFEQIDNAVSLLDAWPTFTGERRRNMLGKLGGLIGRMHRLGLVHGDLNWRNILVRQRLSGTEAFLVDLDGSRFLGKMNRDAARRDMDHFFRDLQRVGATDVEMQIFNQAWGSSFSGTRKSLVEM